MSGHYSGRGYWTSPGYGDDAPDGPADSGAWECNCGEWLHEGDDLDAHAAERHATADEYALPL